MRAARVKQIVGRALATTFLITSAVASERLPLPGVGAEDNRTRVDPNTKPWHAVGKLQASAGNLHTSCTGTMIGPATVLTAAHCLINPRTQNYFLASSLHFLLGYDGGNFTGHARGASLSVAPGYDLKNPARSYGSDWAVVTLEKPLISPDRVLRLRTETPAVGINVATGGYGQDHALILKADTACRVVGAAKDGQGRALVQHDCAATRGVSGAPLMAQDTAGWHVIGVVVAGALGVGGGAAVVVTDAMTKALQQE